MLQEKKNECKSIKGIKYELRPLRAMHILVQNTRYVNDEAMFSFFALVLNYEAIFYGAKCREKIIQGINSISYFFFFH